MRITDEHIQRILTDETTCADTSRVQLALDLRDEREERRDDARALWAVRVLDAWAGEHGDYARSWENCRKRGNDWVLLTDGGPYMIPGPTPDAARLAAAQAVYPNLPADARAKLGECP